MDNCNKITELSQYQCAAVRTLNVNIEPFVALLAVNTLGLAGEAGEVADYIKKHIGHGHELSVDKVVDELGDVLYYIAAISHVLGISLDQVAQKNIEKLQKRYPNGFTVEDSVNRRI